MREAAIKVIATVLKNLEIESGSEQETEIIEGVDFKSISAKLVDDPGVCATLKLTIKNFIENCESDEFNETVKEAFGLNDADRLVELLSEETKGNLNKVVVDKVRACVEGWDTGDLDNDTVTEMEKAVFTPERINSCLSSHTEGITETVTACIMAIIKAAGDRADGYESFA